MNDLLDYATVGNIYQTLVPFYGSHYYDDYHDYYIGSIHERTKPIFVDNKVQNLYDAETLSGSCVTDGYHDMGIDAVYNDSTQKKLVLVQSKWRRDGTGGISQEEAGSFAQGVKRIILCFGIVAVA